MLPCRRASGGAAALSGAGVDVSACGRIVVAGGGIGGAAAAVALQRRGFDVVVLEADSSFDARKQGYGLTIQRQDATQAMGINLAQVRGLVARSNYICHGGQSGAPHSHGAPCVCLRAPRARPTAGRRSVDIALHLLCGGAHFGVLR